MNESSNHDPSPAQVEEGCNALLSKARKEICERHQQCENRIRKSPTTAVLGAVAVGYILHRLPLRAIFVAKVRMLWALTPPALFLLGAAKLYNFLKNQEAKQE